MTSARDLIRFLSMALVLLAVSGLIIAFIVGRSCFTRDPDATIAEEIKDVPAAFEMKARDLLEAYLADEDASALIYNGKVGIISGIEATSSVINQRNPPRDQSNSVYFFTNGVWFVRCGMSDKEKAKFRENRRTRYSGLFSLKGRVEGVNDRHLIIELRGCTIQDSS